MNKDNAMELIDSIMIDLNIKQDMKTEPILFRKLLKEMKLDDFETNFKPASSFFKKIKSRPQNLKPFFEDIKKGIVNKHPAIIEFLYEAEEKRWFKHSEEIIVSVHFAYILEFLTSSIINNNEFSLELKNHFFKKREQYGINSKSLPKTIFKTWKLTGSLFQSVKMASIDPVVTSYYYIRNIKTHSFSREYVKGLYKKKEITFLEYLAMLPPKKETLRKKYDALKMNIYEAATDEYHYGFEENALSGHILCQDIFKNPPAWKVKHGKVFPKHSNNKFYSDLGNDKNYFLSYNFSSDWVSLYGSWNMAFILGKLNDLHMIFPKLLIPSVIDAQEEYYLSSRAIGLWLVINFLLFRRLDKREEIKGPKNKIEMAKRWGEINKKYALLLSEEEAHISIKRMKKSFKKRFRHPAYNLSKEIIKDFFMK